MIVVSIHAIIYNNYSNILHIMIHQLLKIQIYSKSIKNK